MSRESESKKFDIQCIYNEDHERIECNLPPEGLEVTPRTPIMAVTLQLFKVDLGLIVIMGILGFVMVGLQGGLIQSYGTWYSDGIVGALTLIAFYLYMHIICLALTFGGIFYLDSAILGENLLAQFSLEATVLTNLIFNFFYILGVIFFILLVIRIVCYGVKMYQDFQGEQLKSEE